jgi:hypothetical protein
MRILLAPYLGNFVHCSGWITDWENLDNENRRIYVSNVTVKQPDRMLTYDKQNTICKIDHLNIFCKKDYNPPIEKEKYQRIAFSGTVIQYTRKDGSMDYGIQQVQQTHAYEILEFVNRVITALTIRKKGKAKNYFRILEITDFLLTLEDAIEEQGDYLPTFDCDYLYYKETIKQMVECLRFAADEIKFLCGNRRLRRKSKISSKLAEQILA